VDPLTDIRTLGNIAPRKNTTPAQIALAWLLAQKPWIGPIPGTRRLERPDENLGVVAVELTSDDLRDIDPPPRRSPRTVPGFPNILSNKPILER
jgi:aryl-alcohol dehydrogenase-like predicted oxidoreductase